MEHWVKSGISGLLSKRTYKICEATQRISPLLHVVLQHCFYKRTRETFDTLWSYQMKAIHTSPSLESAILNCAPHSTWITPNVFNRSIFIGMAQPSDPPRPDLQQNIHNYDIYESKYYFVMNGGSWNETFFLWINGTIKTFRRLIPRQAKKPSL